MWVRCECGDVWQCDVMVYNQQTRSENQYLLVKFEFKLMKCLQVKDRLRLVKTGLGRSSIFQNHDGL